MIGRAGMLGLLLFAVAAWPHAQTATEISYAVTFPAPEHHWMQVDVTFPDVESTPFVIRMSRSSPGRYAVHEFAKNVFSIEAFGRAGQRLAPKRTGADEWTIDGHDGTVRVVYRIFGDQLDGTYLAIDSTHAHINMPAAFMWSPGLETRPMRVRFIAPAGSSWRAATQLFPTSDETTFTAPNLQYLMDSPTELSRWLMSSVAVQAAAGPEARIRLAVHSAAGQSDADELARLVQRVIREQAAVFGELPSFESGQYTFLLDYVPWADGDAMEHRNSTAITSAGIALDTPDGRRRALGSIAHEFFHVWNVERIRPAGLEPFDFSRQNVTCCLWLAEGFTEYYGPLSLVRAGLAEQAPIASAAALVNAPGRTVRSAVEMSEHAPFADAGVANDVDDRSRTYLSYYTHGAAIALALDFALRDRTAGRVSLDDLMRRLWLDFGKTVDPRPGHVARPYTLADLRRVLAAVAADQAFADDFFDRFIEGRDVPDFERLLALAGYLLRPIAPRAWAGSPRLREEPNGLLVGIRGLQDRPEPVPFGTPLYEAGIDSGDRIVAIGGAPATMAAWLALGSRNIGERVTLSVRRRDGRTEETSVVLRPDPTLRIVPVETTGAPLSPAAKAFRDAWLAAKAGAN